MSSRSFRVNLHSIVCLNVKELLTWSRGHIWMVECSLTNYVVVGSNSVAATQKLLPHSDKSFQIQNSLTPKVLLLCLFNSLSGKYQQNFDLNFKRALRDITTKEGFYVWKILPEWRSSFSKLFSVLLMSSILISNYLHMSHAKKHCIFWP